MKYIGRTNEFGLFSEDGSGYYGYFIVTAEFGVAECQFISLWVIYCVEYINV